MLGLGAMHKGSVRTIFAKITIIAWADLKDAGFLILGNPKPQIVVTIFLSIFLYYVI